MKTIYVALTIAFFAESATYGQRTRCQDYLKDMRAVAAKENGYGPQKIFGDETFRCEGIYSIGTSGEPVDLAVVSLTVGPIAYQLSPTLTLEVAVAPRVRTAGPVRIRALPQREGKNYQMDAAIPATGRLTWPAGIILNSYGIAGTQLGVYGVAEQDGSEIFVPLIVSSPNAPAPVQPPTLLAVRYPYTLSRLGWKVGRMDGAGECVTTARFQWILNNEGRIPIQINLTGMEGDCLAFRLQRTSGATSTPAMLRIALPQ